MIDPKHLVSAVEQAIQNDNLPEQTGFKQIDLKIAYRALIDGFLQLDMEETDNNQNQGAKPDKENS